MYSVIVPARSGSKRIPEKNLIKFRGKTLVERAIKCGKSADRIIVATDSIKIKKLIENYNVEIYCRSQASSIDTANISVLLNEMIYDKTLKLDEIVILLQPTSPLRSTYHVQAAIDMYENRERRSVVSGYKTEQIPYKFFVSDENGNFKPYSHMFANSAQFLPDYFYPNGAIYLFSVKDYVANNYQLPLHGCLFLDMGYSLSLDIDTFGDLKKLEDYGSVEFWTD